MGKYDPYASLGFKGKKAKKKSDAAAKKQVALRGEAKRYPTSPGARTYLKKTAPKPRGTAQQRREKRLAGVRTGTHRIKYDAVDARHLNPRLLRTKTLKVRPLPKDDPWWKDVAKVPIAVGKESIKFTAHGGSLGYVVDKALDPDNKHKKKALVASVKMVNKVDKGLTKVEKKYPNAPGVSRMMGFPGLTELHKGAKSFWYSGNAINAGVYNATRGKWKKIPSEVEKASQGKVTYSGKKVIGEKWAKKKGNLGTILGGAEEFAAETPAALVGGGSGTAARQAAREAGRKATLEYIEAEVKKAGAKSAKDLPDDVIKKATASGERASRKVFMDVSAKKGKGRDYYVGVEFKVPFSNRKVSKLAPVDVGNATAKVRRRLDAAEAGGKRTGKVIGKVRDAGNTANRNVNPYATGRRATPMAAKVTHDEGLKLRGRQLAADDYGHDLAAALHHAANEAGAKTDKEVQRFVTGLMGRVEREGPESKSPMIRELFRATNEPHTARVRAGLAQEWGGQRLTRHDLVNLAMGSQAKRGRAQVKRRVDRNVKYANRKVIKAERKEAKELGRLEIVERTQRKGRKAVVQYEERAARQGAKAAPAAGRQRLDDALAKTAQRKTNDISTANNALINARGALAAATKEREAIRKTHMRSQYKGQQYAVKGKVGHAEGATGTAKQNIKAIEAADKRVSEATARLTAAEDGYRAAKGMAPAARRVTKQVVSRAGSRAAQGAKAAATGKQAEAVGRMVDPKAHARARVRARAASEGATEARENAVKVRKAAPSNAGRQQAYDDLLTEIKEFPETADLAGTEKALTRWAARADEIGAPSLATRLRRTAKTKKATPPYHSIRRYASNPTDELNDIERALASKSLVDDTHRIRRTMGARKALRTGEYDFSPEAVGHAAKKNLTDTAESDFWKRMGRIHASEADESGKWYTMGANGLQSFPSKRAAARHASQQEGETYVRQLSDGTVEQLKRQARANKFDKHVNTFSRSVQKTVGLWKQVAVTTPRGQARNVVGDTVRGVSIAGGRPFRNVSHAVSGTKAMARQRKIARTATRFAGEVQKGKLSEREIFALLDKPIKMGYGKNKHYVKVGDLLDEFTRYGGASSTFVRGEIETGGRVKAFGRLGDWINYREHAQRFNTFISLRAQGYTPADAVEMMMRGHIDYGHRSPLEEALSRFIAPFIVFRGRNMATYAGKMVRKPGRVQKYITAFDTMAQLAGYKDYEQFEDEAGRAARGLILPLAGVKDWNSSPDLPFNDLYRTWKQAREGDASAIGDSIAFGNLMVTLGGVLKDNKLDDRPLRPIPDSIATAIKKAGLGEKLRLEKKEGPDGKLHWHAHPIVYELLNMNPETGTVARATAANEGEAVTWGNLLTGAGLTKIEAHQGELERINKRINYLDTRLMDKYGATTATDAQRKKMRKELDALRQRRTEIYAGRGSASAKKKLNKGGSTSSAGFGSGSSGFGSGSFGSGSGFGSNW